jgi:iron-sulfur cluster repair protein YtfE (RIC family)
MFFLSKAKAPIFDKTDQILELTEYLPETLRTELVKHLFKDLIELFPMLKDHPNDFYSKVLRQLKVRNF